MIQQLTYEELEQRIQELTKEPFERMRAEEALEESETRYRRLFETAQDGILILDADTERRRHNLYSSTFRASQNGRTYRICNGERL